MKELTLEEVKTIQLDIMSAVDEFCREHNIRYSLACGTLLGAVRHGGYIPWDDDIDIYMLRSEYNRFAKEFPTMFKERYAFANLERDPKWEMSFGKVYDSTTLLIENTDHSYRIGINIDVFPVDSVPDDEVQWKRYNKWRKRLVHFHMLKTVKFRKDRSIGKNIVLAFSKLLALPWSTRQLAVKVDRVAQRYNDKPAQYVFENCQGIYTRHRHQRTIFDQLKPIKFEDLEFMAFADYDAILTNTYGDYMTPPPPEKRITHHDYKAYKKD